jgi:acyl-homoserine lactone synthase
MLQILRSHETPAGDLVLREMFAARKAVFVDLLKWSVPVVDGAYERDQYDDEDATYLVLTDGGGRHLGSTRLLRTDRPHILGSLYPELCAGGAPRGANIREITRFCLDRRLKAAERRKVRDTLIMALADHALATGIRAYSAIAQLGWFEQILAFGWRCRPLGTPRSRDGAVLAALRIDIAGDTPALLRATGIVPSVRLANRLEAAA